MRALTLWRPWPWSIVHGPKRLENRMWAPWPSIIGKRIAIHAGVKYDEEGAEYIRGHLMQPQLVPSKTSDPQGIIGTAIVSRYLIKRDPEDLVPSDLPPDGQAVWYFGPFAWVLDDVRALSEPIPCKGAQGLWVVPIDIVRRIEAQHG